jgi:hypothetical protein
MPQRRGTAEEMKAMRMTSMLGLTWRLLISREGALGRRLFLERHLARPGPSLPTRTVTADATLRNVAPVAPGGSIAGTAS